MAAATLAACDRPFVPLDPPSIEVLSPDLSEVQTAGRLAVVVRVTAVRGVSTVTIDGDPATTLPGQDLYTDTLDVAPGLNAYVIEAAGSDGNDVRDTLFVLRAEPESVVASGSLPEPRALHSSTLLDGGAILVSGGVGGGGAVLSSAYLLRESAPFVVDVSPAGGLGTARAGHSSHRLPDGRILILGGASRAEPASEEDFVTIAEIYDPAGAAAAPVASTGDPVRRSGHVAFVLSAAGRTFLYIVGGRGPVGEGVGTPSSVVIAELRGPAGADTLATLTPAGGAGILEPVTAPAGALLPPSGAEGRALVTGVYAPDGTPVTTRLRFLPGSGLYPFQILEERIAAPEEPRGGAAVAALDGSLLLLGGRDAAGMPTPRLSIFAPAAGRWFSVPLQRAGLRVTRFGHTATSLPSGRIAVVGGYTQPGTPTAITEIVFTD